MIPILLTLAIGQPNKPVSAEVLQGIRDSSVRVQFSVHYADGKMNTATSSGTVIEAGKDEFVVLTCSHGLYWNKRRQDKFNVRSMTGQDYPAVLITDDPARDVAVLRVRVKDHPFKPSAVAKSDEYKAKTDAIRIGYPRNKHRTIVRATLTGQLVWINNDEENEAATVNPAAIQGDSGGGLFRSSDGKLIGMTVMTTEGADESTAVTLKTIRYVLNKAGVKQ